MIDIQKDYMYQFIQADLEGLKGEDAVDSVRLIKTNREFYVKLLTLFFKFWEGNKVSFQTEDMTSDFSSFACTHFRESPQYNQLRKVVTFSSQILCGHTFEYRSKPLAYEQLFSHFA